MPASDTLLPPKSLSPHVIRGQLFALELPTAGLLPVPLPFKNIFRILDNSKSKFIAGVSSNPPEEEQGLELLV